MLERDMVKALCDEPMWFAESNEHIWIRFESDGSGQVCLLLAVYYAVSVESYLGVIFIVFVDSVLIGKLLCLSKVGLC